MKNKIIKIILVISIFFTTISGVNAKILITNNIANEIKNTTPAKELLEKDLELTGKVDTTSNQIQVYCQNDKIISFNIGKNYLEYDNRDFNSSSINEVEDKTSWIIKMNAIYSIVEAIFRLSGYENYTISDEYDYTLPYEQYGLLIETKEYEVNEQVGEELTYLKISTDTEKISSLIKTYGVSIQENSKELISTLVPDIEVKNITGTSATIYMDIPNYSLDDFEENVLCNLYRADTKDGLYKKVNNWGVYCLDSVGIVDDSLESGKTYYYKTIVEGSNDYSKLIEVNTKIALSSVVDDVDKITKNPKTGKIYSIAIFFIILLLNIATIVYVRKNYY